MKQDTRPWIDKGRYCYPLCIAVGLAFWYLLSGCQTLPPKDVYVVWKPCDSPVQTVRVRFVDTVFPPLACVQRSLEVGNKGDAIVWSMLTLIGMPPAACTLYAPGYAEIYAPISPGPTQLFNLMATVGMTPNDILIHELGHAFGQEHATLTQMEGCKP